MSINNIKMCKIFLCSIFLAFLSGCWSSGKKVDTSENFGAYVMSSFSNQELDELFTDLSEETSIKGPIEVNAYSLQLRKSYNNRVLSTHYQVKNEKLSFFNFGKNKEYLKYIHNLRACDSRTTFLIMKKGFSYRNVFQDEQGHQLIDTTYDISTCDHYIAQQNDQRIAGAVSYIRSFLPIPFTMFEKIEGIEAIDIQKTEDDVIQTYHVPIKSNLSAVQVAGYKRDIQEKVESYKCKYPEKLFMKYGYNFRARFVDQDGRLLLEKILTMKDCKAAIKREIKESL